MPGAPYIVSNMSATSVFNPSSNTSTGLEIWRRTGSGVSWIRRMAMAFHMAENRRFSTGRSLPQLDRIAFRIMDAREAADAGGVPFGLGDHVDAGFAELVEQLVEALDAEVQHVLAVGREIIAVGGERREDG